METKSGNGKRAANRKLPIIIAAIVVVLLLLVLGALLLFGGGEPGPTPTEPTTNTQESTEPTESDPPPAVEVPAKVWDMEGLAENLIEAGMAYANSSNTIYGNLIIGGAEGKGLGGSTAFGYTFVGNKDNNDVFVMSPVSLKGQNLVTDWSNGEMLWFWVNGTELLQNVRLYVTINGKYLPIGSTYYTIDKAGECVPVGTIPEAFGTTKTQGAIRLNQGWEGWIGLPIEETYGEIKTLTSIQIVVGNSTIKAGNILYLDEFWLTGMNEVPPLSVEELNYSAIDALLQSLTLGKIWDVEGADAGTAIGTVATTAGRNNATSEVFGNKGVLGSKAWGYVLDQVENTNSQNVNLSTIAMAKLGVETRAIKSPSDMFWFWVDSDLSASVMLHLQFNGIFQARQGIYTIAVKNGEPVITPVGSYDSKGSVNGVSVVPNNGSATGSYGRIEISANWSGWIGIPVGNFCVNSDGTPADIPVGKTGGLTVRLYAPANSFKVGDTLYFDEFWMTEAGKMPELSKEALCYGYTASQEKPTVGYGQIWDGGDGNKVAAGTQIGSVGSAADRNVVTTPVVDGKGVGGSKGMSYVLGSVNKTNGNNLTLISGDLSEFGYKIANVGGLDDILWIWVDSLQTEDQLLHLQVNSVQTHLKQAPIYSIAPDEDGKAVIVEVPFYDAASSCVNGVGVVPQGGYARVKLCKGWSGWIGIPVGHFSVNSSGEPSDNPMEKISSITIRNFATANTLTAGDAIVFDELWLTKKETMPALTNEQLLYGYTEIEKVEISDGGQIWDAGDGKQIADSTAAGSAGKDSGRTTVNSYISAGKGVKDTNALTYYLAGNFKNNGNNVTLNAGDLADLGFNVTSISDKTDILWFWLKSGQTADQLLHIQLNGIFLKQAAIYTVVDENGTPAIKEIAYNDLTGGVGVTDSNWNGQGKYARIYVKSGFSGWVGIPISNFSVTSSGEAAELPGDTLTQLIIRNYGVGTSFVKGAGLYFDEFWLTESGKMPGLSNEELLWTSTETIEPSEPDNTEGSEPSEPDNTEGSEPSEPAAQPHQTPLQNFDLVANGEFGYLNQGYKGDITTALRVAEEIGLLASKGWNYAYVSGGNTNSDNFYLRYKGEDKHMAETVITSQSDILWFWVHSNLSGTKAMHIQLNSSHLAKLPVYTIGDNNNDGTPEIIEVPYVNDPAAVTTMAPVDSSLNNTDTSTGYCRIAFAEGWSGWVGIPVKNFSGNNTNAPEAGAVLADICMRLYTKAKANWNADENITLDEFWLTSAGKMPNLSNEALLYTYTPPVVTEINLTNRFQNGMIFQQNKPWIVNGTGVIGETVTVELINKENATVQTKTATVDADSNWTVTMDGVAGSYDAYTVKVSSGNNSKTIENVVFGEVWAAGGQSNMAYTVYRDPSGDTVLTEADMNALQAELAAYEKAGYIRFFMSGAAHAGGLVNEDVTGSWSNASNWDAVRSCSATALYFAKNLEAVLNVPVGVVVGAQGGTMLSAWVDPEIAQADADFYKAVQDLGYVGGSAEQRAMLGGWFNSRVAAWAGFEVNGFIWYQGEHDSGKPAPQKLGFDVLVDSWSKVFNSEATVDALPLVAIQIAPYASSNPSVAKMDETNELNAAMLEGVKALTSKATVVQIYDLFIDITNHHPQHKPALSARAAVAALNMVYGKGSVASGPVLESADYSIAGQITLTFGNVGSGLKYIQLTEEANKRYEPEGFAMPTDMYVDAINGFSVWTGTEYLDITNAAFVGHNQIVLTLPEGVEPAGVCYGRSMDILTANVYNEEGFPAVPFEHVRPGFTITHKTPLWNADSNEATVIVENNVYTKDPDARNISKISIGKFGIGGSNALRYELVTTGKDRTNTWNWNNPGDYGFRTDVSIAADDDILWFYLEANVSTVQRLQTYVPASNSNSYVYTLAGTTGNMSLVKVPYGGDDPVEGLALLRHSDTQAQLQIEPGFKGWIGFPVSQIGFAKGDCITSFSALLLQKAGEDPAGFEGQKVGDNVTFDEFWLTSAGEYPTVATGDQSVKVRYQLTNFENLDETHKFTENGGGANIDAMLDTANGLNGSKALAYKLLSVVDQNPVQLFPEADKFGEYAIHSKTDLIWIWMDSDQSGDRCFFWQINGTAMCSLDEIYTIVDSNDDGVAEIKAVSYCDAWDKVDGMAPVNYKENGSYTGTMARILVKAGWSGWIGVPVGYYNLDAGSTIANTQLRMLFNNNGGTKAGEFVYFDELWITSAGLMPGLTDEELLWADADKDEESDEEEKEAYRTPLLDLEALDVDAAIGTIGGNSKYTVFSSTVASGSGLRSSKAIKYAFKTSGNSNSKNLTLTAGTHTANADIKASTDILWFWIDSDLIADRLLHVQMNGVFMGKKAIYTIGDANEDGFAEIITVDYVADPTTVSTMAPVDSNNANVDATSGYCRIKIAKDWSGWIGIPVENFCCTSAGAAMDVPSGALASLVFRLFNCGTAFSADDVLYFDEFWLTSENTMPGLTNAQLLNKEEPSAILIDWNKASDEAKNSLVTQSPAVTTNSMYECDAFGMVDYNGGYAVSMGKIESGTITKNQYTGWLHLDTTQATAGATIGMADYTFDSTDILWIWFDGTGINEANGGCRITITLGGKNMTDTHSYYTIGKDGKLVKNTAVNFRDSASNHQGGVPVSCSFKGWVGIPLANYADQGATNLGVLKFALRRFTSQNTMGLGDNLIIGNFWIGEKVGDTWAIPSIAEADYR